MMITEERARELRSVIETVMQDVSDDIAVTAPELFGSFDGDSHAYAVGDKVRYNGTLYKVLQAHTSQADWTPDAAPSLFARVLIETDESGEQIEIPEWEQPDSTNAYSTGDKVMFNGKVYVSKIDNNVWSPSDYPQGWQEVTEGNN